MKDKVTNIVADVLLTEMQYTLPRTEGACLCDQCVLDVFTLALNQLPPQYVSGTRGYDEFRKAASTRFGGLMNKVLHMAIEKVKARPRPGYTRRYGFFMASVATPDVDTFDEHQEITVGRGPVTYFQIKPTGRRAY